VGRPLDRSHSERGGWRGSLRSFCLDPRGASPRTCTVRASWTRLPKHPRCLGAEAVRVGGWHEAGWPSCTRSRWLRLLRGSRGTVLTVRREVCPSCGYLLYERGRSKLIEAARTSDGREPAEEFIVALEASRKWKDTQRIADIVTLFEQYAGTGELEEPRELNHLRDDLWEIKPGDVRLSFYEIEHGAHDLPVIRLTTGFFKTQWPTQERHIRWGLRVMREDRAA
jgi:hypothetical protein